MKALFCALLLLLMLPAYSSAQTTYTEEITKRKNEAQRLRRELKQMEQRKYVIETSEMEYQECATAKVYIDDKIRACMANNTCVNLFEKLDPSSQNFGKKTIVGTKNRLAASLGLSIAGGKAPLKKYRDIEYYVSFYGQKLPEMRKELYQLLKDIPKRQSRLQRIEKEIAVLKDARSRVAGRAALEGQWTLGGGGKVNIISVKYIRQDDFYHGMVIQSANLLCHPEGTELFSVRKITTSDGTGVYFKGKEFGYDHFPNGDCRPKHSNLVLNVNGDRMTYNNGSQNLILQRVSQARSNTIHFGN